MELTSQQEQNIDNYLSGRMGAEESSSFEREIQSNPELQQEISFQKTIVEGVRAYKKEQIKAHLMTIDVTPGLWETFISSVAGKVVTGITASAVIGTGAYLYFDSNDVTTEIETVEYVESAPIIEDVPEEIVAVEEVSEVIATEGKTTVQPVKVFEEKKAVAMVEEDKPIINTESSYTPKIELPDSDPSIEDQFESETIEIYDYINPNAATSTKIVNVEIRESSGSQMYTFYDSKLALFGDFNDQPYEILEINAAGSKDFYLMYKDKFYQLKTTSVKINLEPLIDNEVIRELMILKENK